MTREETIAAGMDVHEIQHSMVRLQSQGDTYMLTLVVRARGALSGQLKSAFYQYGLMESQIIRERLT